MLLYGQKDLVYYIIFLTDVACHVFSWRAFHYSDLVIYKIQRKIELFAPFEQVIIVMIFFFLVIG